MASIEQDSLYTRVPAADVHRQASGQAARALCLVLVALCPIVALVFPSSTVQAAVVGKATGSRDAREDALRSIPFNKLESQVRQQISDVVQRPTIYRRMPIKVIDCDPELYRFLVRYPEVVVNIWQLMEITKVSLQRTGPFSLDAADGAGTVSSMELVYGDRDTHLIYCSGAYEGPLFRRPVNGRCVLLLKSGLVETQQQRTHIVNRLDVFLQLDNPAAEVLTKTLHPLVGRSADINFVESTNFLQRISQTAEQNGPGMQRLAQRLNDVHPAVRSRFAELVETVAANNGATDDLRVASTADTPIYDGRQGQGHRQSRPNPETNRATPDAR